MDLNDMMMLVKAGFTKDEIMSLSGTVHETPKDNNDVVIEETTKEVEEDVKEEVPVKNNSEDTKSNPTTTNVNFAPMMTDAQVEKLAQMLNRGTATIDLPQPRKTEDILNDHFKDLMLGRD